jgi:hypothetical protein
LSSVASSSGGVASSGLSLVGRSSGFFSLLFGGGAVASGESDGRSGDQSSKFDLHEKTPER